MHWLSRCSTVTEFRLSSLCKQFQWSAHLPWSDNRDRVHAKVVTPFFPSYFTPQGKSSYRGGTLAKVLISLLEYATFAYLIKLLINNGYRILLHSSQLRLVTVAARCKAWTVFSCSNTGIVGSSPTWDMDICVDLFCVCAVLCVKVAALWRADRPSKESYRLCIRSWKWKVAKVQQRAVEP
jgi:hypothetical protein